MLRLWLGALALLAASCDTGGEAVCREYLALLSEALAPCGVPKELGEPLLRDAMRCDDVIGVLDETALREQCFAALPKISCDDVRARRYPAACSGQLIYYDSLTGWAN